MDSSRREVGQVVVLSAALDWRVRRVLSMVVAVAVAMAVDRVAIVVAAFMVAG